jgi:hypothetical protein
METCSLKYIFGSSFGKWVLEGYVAKADGIVYLERALGTWSVSDLGHSLYHFEDFHASNLCLHKGLHIWSDTQKLLYTNHNTHKNNQ